MGSFALWGDDQLPRFSSGTNATQDNADWQSRTFVPQMDQHEMLIRIDQCDGPYQRRPVIASGCDGLCTMVEKQTARGEQSTEADGQKEKEETIHKREGYQILDP